MTSWSDIILGRTSPQEAWSQLFSNLAELSSATTSPLDLHNNTIEPDRLLAEAAWDLWLGYSTAARRTSQALREWWDAAVGQGRAILILDALSLRELSALLGGASARHIQPSRLEVTGSEIPTDTDAFAHAIGLPSRASLSHSGAPSSFPLAVNSLWTDVLSLPFEDCMAMIPPTPNVIVWHSWLDNLLHVHERTPDHFCQAAAGGVQSDGFWHLVDRLRTGRRLLITSDHGYAVSRLFSTNETDSEVIAALREVFGASRCVPAIQPWTRALLPPVVLTHNQHHVIMGQRKWSIQGGFPFICHGGMSLLEAAVPFVELPPL